MQSTNQNLRPIALIASQIGDLNGYHEITEPNLSATRQCRGCSPVVEITGTGWLDTQVKDQHGSTERLDPALLITQAPPIATVSAGSATVVIEQELDGDTFDRRPIYCRSW